jgi:ATP-dependent helicase/nuclease subunit A
VADVPGEALLMAMRAPNPEQLAAIEAPGLVFLSAGAGTGKTTVLVERFVRALCDRGLPVESLLVITYTERAAGELRGRIRAALQERGAGEPDPARAAQLRRLGRELDVAWISTIHGFCLRLLRAHPFAAGLDPRLRVLDESQALVLRREAFDAALAEFCADGDGARTRLLVSYGSRGLRRMLTGIFETLRAAGRPLVLDLGAAPERPAAEQSFRLEAECLLGETGISEQARSSAQGALDLLADRPGPERLLDLREFAVQGERAESYELARRVLEAAARDELALRDRDLLQELLALFDRAYRQAKERESALDFEDLQLIARDLLRDHAEVRAHERARLRAIMVDEFQDTNRLQCELIDLLAGEVGGDGVEELFFVGDEFQSIYRFRHADVSVFRERRAQSGGVLALTRNYRARPEVISVINHLFGADFGEEFQPLSAAGRFADPVFGTPVELLVTDKASYSGSGVHWRRAEARHIARRVRELVDSGAAEPGEIVLLFAAGTQAEWYEEELRAVGLATYRVAGRGYFGQQQVVDLVAYLRLLHNRYDDEALVTVLASPLVGVSNDALALLRRAAGRRPLFCGLERGLPEDLDPRDERLFRAFRQRYERLAAAAEALSLEHLCEQIVCEHDYDLAVLAQPDGRRRYANMRKLARLARSFEELRGPDIEGFVRFVRDQDGLDSPEQQAVAEEEGGDAVRLLTIHAAKGLEFKVVVVADAGRDRARPAPDEVLCLPDGRFGFRVADPATGERRPAFAYEEVKQVEGAEADAERRRLYYVAMTRAIDRLIVSGAIDPGRSADASTPIGWVLSRLQPRELEQAGEGPVEIVRGSARVLVRVDRYRPGAEQPPGPAPPERPSVRETAGQLMLFDPAPAAAPLPSAPVLARLEPVPEPPLHRARRLSFTALSLHARCSYRYLVERVLGLGPSREPRLHDGEAVPGLSGTEIGSAVHALLEAVDLRRPAPPPHEHLVESVRLLHPLATDEDVARIERLVTSYCESELARRLARMPVLEVERPFAFEHRGVLLHGRLDVLARSGGRWFVLDYKTNLLAAQAPEDIVAREYVLQRLVYALACFRAGAEEVEVVYCFLEQPDALVSRTFSRGEEQELEAGLSAAIDLINSGDFRPTPGEMVCADCPALGLVCAGTGLPEAPARPRALAGSG